MEISNYRDSLQYLYSLQRMGIKLGLNNIGQLLQSLGNPQDKLKSVHIAGSNGKGSTCAYLADILKAAGYKTGLFTSPHLIDFTERIKINGEQIPKDQVVKLSNKIQQVIGENPQFAGQTNYPTFFEVVTALAFAYFWAEKVDFVVLETGMGGRLDATNVVVPMLSVITNICLEHTVYLGDTLEKIAYEKAGIIKNGIPLLTAAEQDEVIKCFSQTCREKSSPLHRLQDEVKIDIKQRWPWQIFSLQTPTGKFSDLRINMLGDYQLQNTALAVRSAQILAENGLLIGESDIRQGLFATSWPGRLQVLNASPWIILDGAHNPAALSLLVPNLELFPYQKLIMVIGMMEDKDLDAMLKLLDKVDILILTQAGIGRAASVQKIAGKMQNFPGQIIFSQNVKQGLQNALMCAQKEDLICVTGSLYVVGEAQAYLTGKPLEAIRSIQ
ncbi:MAG: bifunctional folylpolyglutamate synthase/dihydrofolate synthase [Candidatus Schekmanbacteria bacterium]|nr:bifunctional folylpolyglutamate synthase/dihydrofolate synthase [Candidatus Schekmanbacteria bacterium]